AAGSGKETKTDPIGELGGFATRTISSAFGGTTVLWLLDEAGDLLDAVASAAEDPATSGVLTRALGRARPSAVLGLLGRVLSTGAPVEAPQAAWRQLGEWGDLDAVDLLEATGPMAFCLVPVRARAHAIGALLLGRTASHGMPSPSERTLLQDVADQVGLAVANERLSRSTATHLSARRAAEEALAASEARVRGIARSGPVLLFAYDRDGTFTLLDGGLLAEFGQLPGVFVGRNFFSVYKDYPEFLELGRRVLEGEQLKCVPVPLQGHHLEAWGVPLRTARGEPDGAAGIIVDVSARVAAEQLVLDSARRESALVEHASDVIIVMARDGAVLYANPAARRLLGESWHEGKPLEFASLIHPEDRERVLRHFTEAAEQAGSAPPIEYRIAHADGSWRTVESIGNNLIDDPAVNGFIVTLRDVTTRRASEERLRSNAGRQAALADLGRWALVGLAFPNLVEDAVTLLAEQMEVDFVHVFEAMPDSAFVTLTASHGHGPSGPELLSTDPTSSPVSFALVTQETVICGDLAREARFEVPDLWTRSQAMSVIEVPIPGQDSPAGVLGVGCRSPREFADEDINFVVAVANILAAAAARGRAEGAIRDQALHDPLTGLPNRLVLADHGHTIAVPKLSEMSGVERTVLVLDIDRFKEINDTLGHALGDLVLLEVARRLRELGGPVELVARLGGDEFAVVASSAREPVDADAMAARLLAALAEAIDVGGVRLRLRGSVGVATADVDEKGTSLGVPALLRRAEVAMYQAKAERRGVRRYSDDLERSSLSRLALASELADAVDKGELRLDYQPKIDALTKAVTGVEALVRWRHPTRGLLLPDVFIPIAEQTGMIRELTNWVLAKALSECVGWHRSGRLIPVAVNLSAATVHDPELMDAVTTAVSRSGLPPHSVEFEITESAVMLDPEGALRSLEALVAYGVRLSLDDFGTGYSSLSYLQRLPVTAVKIDKSFVEPLLRDDTAKAIVHAVVNLAHSLSLSVIAEGVDSAPVMEQLTALGCDALQGFYVAIPMSPDRLEQWIASNSGTSTPRRP
ncbi:MAG TPA: EAL domain-containing protein, partial [Acidimicrobiales bacterium]|nr:EAL domain-containing protein [Acidimicrobiales bacterium]